MPVKIATKNLTEKVLLSFCTVVRPLIEKNPGIVVQTKVTFSLPDACAEFLVRGKLVGRARENNEKVLLLLEGRPSIITIILYGASATYGENRRVCGTNFRLDGQDISFRWAIGTHRAPVVSFLMVMNSWAVPAVQFSI